jgi:uncharacterized protein YndB with AHSA1/START domain
MSAELADDELLITRTFDAPASVLFALWSEPEHMKRWMGRRISPAPSPRSISASAARTAR